MSPNRNAFIGRNIEILFKNSIGDNPSIVKKIQREFSIQGRFLNAISTGIHSEKADVKMEFADGNNIDANIKAFKKTSVSYNQLTRTPITHFCELFGLTEYEQELKDLFIAKARNRQALLFHDNKWQSIIQKKAKDILLWSFSYKQSREILVIYERIDSIMSIYSMSEVMKIIGTQVEITRKGNIAIGSSVVIQRKGGNGVHTLHIRKDDLKHPGNSVQVKLKMKEFMQEMKDCLLASYHI